MNKRGFTLVEILAVICILSLIIVVVATNGFGAFNSTKNKINEMNKQALVEGAKLIAIEIENCDDDIDKELIDELLDPDPAETKTCDDLINSLETTGCLTTDIGFLKEKEYITGSSIKDLSDDIIINVCKEAGKIVLKDKDGNLFTSTSIIDLPKNPYEDNTNSLAYNIINNVITNTTNNLKDKTTFISKPTTNIGEVSKGISGTGEYETITLENPSYNWIYTANEGNADIDGIAARECTNDMIGKYISEADDMFNTIGEVTDCDGTVPVVKREIVTSESVLSLTEDNYGTSYYYRGNVKDNYVNFNGMCWRIVRIEGDGSTKLVLDDKNTTCNDNDGSDGKKYTNDFIIDTATYGYKTINLDLTEADSFTVPDYENSEDITNSMKYKFNTWLEDNFDSNSKELLKETKICLGEDISKILTKYNINKVYFEEELKTNYTYPTIFFDVFNRINAGNYTLKCNTEYLSEEKYKIYPLTVDEVVFAGASKNLGNEDLYLRNNLDLNTYVYEFRLLTTTGLDSTYSYSYLFNGEGKIESGISGAIFFNTEKMNIRPAISLKKDVKFTGDGTIDNPYVVEE